MTINWNKVIEENRLGRFSITQRDIHEYPNYFNKAFERFLIIDGDFRFDVNGCSYVAYSPFFEKVKQGYESKKYNVPIESFVKEIDDKQTEFIKINWKRFGRDGFVMPDIINEVYNIGN